MNFNTNAIHKLTGLTLRQIDYWDKHTSSSRQSPRLRGMGRRDSIHSPI
jgi:hypothetical protein